MPIRAVLFDLGHTLWDYAPRIEFRRLNVLRLHAVLARTLGDGAPAPAALDRALADATERWLDAWRGERLDQAPSDHVVRDALAALELPPSANLVDELTELLFGAEIDNFVVEPDTLAAIATLDARGYALGCVTNTMLLERGITDGLTRLGLQRYLRCAVASSSMGYRKPHASLFQRALDELGVTPDEAVFVGDRLFDDVRGARGAGMRAVLTHQYRQEALERATVPPDAVIQRLSELPEVVERMNGV